MENEDLVSVSQVNDEFTLISLFFRADIVVKLVILILFASSIFSWTIIIHKIRLFRSLKEISKQFGTVWGIMNSFQSIAISRNTSLAVVAPGIAEALFATALGLLAAIPAVIAYNIFTSQVNDENARMYRFKEHFNVIFSRGLSTK